MAKDSKELTSPYELFEKAKPKELTKEPIVLDYDGHFKIKIKHGGNGNRSFVNAVQAIQRKYARREELARNDQLKPKAVEALAKAKLRDMAALYADHVIVGWEGVTDENKQPMEYNRENVIKLLLDLDALFADIIEQAQNEANFVKEEDEAAEKN